MENKIRMFADKGNRISGTIAIAGKEYRVAPFEVEDEAAPAEKYAAVIERAEDMADIGFPASGENNG